MTTDTFERATDFYRRGYPTMAIELLEWRTKDYVDDGRSWELLGIIQRAAGRFGVAMNALERASILTPLSCDGQLALAHCYLRKDLVDSAEAIYVHVAERYRDLSDECLVDLANGLGALGEVHQALDVCREAAFRQPTNHHAVYAVAHYMGRCGYPTKFTLPILQKAFELAPDVLRYRLSLLLAYAHAGHTVQAVRLLPAVSLEQLSDIDCANCVRRVGALYLMFGDEERGQFCLDLFETLIVEDRASANGSEACR